MVPRSSLVQMTSLPTISSIASIDLRHNAIQIHHWNCIAALAFDMPVSGLDADRMLPTPDSHCGMRL